MRLASLGTVWNRLYDDQMAIRNLREEIKIQKDLNKCTFAPKTGKKNHLKNFVEMYKEVSEIPIHLRLSNREIEEMKEIELLTIKMDLEVEGCTFAPDLGESASGRSEKFGEEGNIFLRLHEDAKNQKILLQNYKKEQEMKELQDCTFTPVINVDVDLPHREGMEEMGIETSYLGDSVGAERIEKLAVPRHVSHKREALEKLNMEENMLRPQHKDILRMFEEEEGGELLAEDLEGGEGREQDVINQMADDEFKQFQQEMQSAAQ